MLGLAIRDGHVADGLAVLVRNLGERLSPSSSLDRQRVLHGRAHSRMWLGSSVCLEPITRVIPARCTGSLLAHLQRHPPPLKKRQDSCRNCFGHLLPFFRDNDDDDDGLKKWKRKALKLKNNNKKSHVIYGLWWVADELCSKKSSALSYDVWLLHPCN